MKIVVLGINYKTTPVGVREKLAFSADDAIDALRDFKSKFPAVEFALLSTCNRVELYCAAGSDDAIKTDDLTKLMADSRSVEVEDFRDFLYVRFDNDAVTHLLTVSSSLDSMVVGESQIIGQVKECFTMACTANSTGKILNKLFHAAFTASKEIYSSTAIATRRVSVAGVAVELAKQLFADITTAKILVVGAGEMGQLLVEHFRHIKCNDITVINRTTQRALDVAKEHEISAAKWDQMDELLLTADIVVASAAVQDYLFRKDDFKAVLKKRRKGGLLAIDIAVPRNFQPEVNDLSGVYLYSIDDLSEVVQQNIKLREGEIDRAIEIICEKTAEYMDWLNSMEIGPLVGQMKAGFEKIRRDETERFFVGSRSEANCKDNMEAMVSRIVNKLLHCVIRNLNVVAREQGSEEAARLATGIVEQARQIAGDGVIKEEDEHEQE
ncbi:MAG: glutamyl-tRNA reductase [Planctomycetes bacterium]|nr:glutamyl-tRNA reductase [Planctomycetota bacterium]